MLDIPSAVSQITDTLIRAGFEAYPVGGCVRDLVLNRKPEDWDVTTSATPEQIVALFSKTVYTNDFGTVTVINEAVEDKNLRAIEVTPFRLEADYSDYRHPDKVKWGKSLEEDLARRDFTINALAYNPHKGQIIDLYGGLTDLKTKTIKTVGQAQERFTEDPLRLLRAIRFLAQLNFVINNETAEAIKDKTFLLKHVSAERIRDEFSKIILSPNPMPGLIIASKLGILSQFLPELEEGIHVEQNGDHIFDVWEHTLRALQCAADKNFTLEVRLATLFHDIAKPRTRRWSEEKKDYTFYGHDVIGARITKNILSRLRYPNKVTNLVVKLVRNHMFFSDIEKISLSAVRRIIANVGPEQVWQLMRVRTCDRVGMGRPKETTYRLRKYHSMIEEALRAPTSVGMLKINGFEVIHETGLKAGPKIGLILHALLYEGLENPEFNIKEKLIARAKELAILPDKQLQKLGEAGKEKKEKKEQEEIREIRSKYHVN